MCIYEFLFQRYLRVRSSGYDVEGAKLRENARPPARLPARTHAHIHARTHARTHTRPRTHTPAYKQPTKHIARRGF